MPMHRSLVVAAVSMLSLAACTKPDDAGPTAARTPSARASFVVSPGPVTVVNVSDDTTAQNETPLAVNPRNSQNLLTGNNDWNSTTGAA